MFDPFSTVFLVFELSWRGHATLGQSSMAVADLKINSV